ncbi:MAG: hypothetical protein LBL46_01420, partial [Rickettsiales bacterium]|nr:hypothetical protein [Rickettsiales bacterium]
MCSTLSGVSPAGGVYASVPTADAALATAATACKYTGPDKINLTGCESEAGKNDAKALSDTVSYTTSWPANEYSYVAKAGYTIAAAPVAGNYSTAQCTACAGNNWSLGGLVTSCSQCIANYEIKGADHTTWAKCEQTCTPGRWIESKTAPTTGPDTSKCADVGVEYWGEAANTTVYQSSATEGNLLGRNHCPVNYRGGSKTDKSAENQCQTECSAGTIVAAANAACTTPETLGTEARKWWFSL